MFTTLQTLRFEAWHTGVKDRRAAGIITARIARLEAGLFGDAKSVGGKVSELRIDFGPGYRLYFTIRGSELIVLLMGGDKGSQVRDIEQARAMATDIHAGP